MAELAVSSDTVDEGRIKLAQILYRKDTEETCATQELIARDAVIVEEDRDNFGSIDPDATMDMARKVESDRPSDRQGMITSKRLLKLLRDDGEDEVSEAVPAVSVPIEPTLTPHKTLT